MASRQFARHIVGGPDGARMQPRSGPGLSRLASQLSRMAGAVDTLIRARTGAAATDAETARLMGMYMPSAADSPELVKSKLNRLDRDLRVMQEQFMRGKGGVENAPQIPSQEVPGQTMMNKAGAQEAPPVVDNGPPSPAAQSPIDLDALAEAAACLDPLPASVVRLAGMVASGEPDLNEIAEIVSYDQALTASLLRSANSSWSATRTPITTVRDAVVRLGYGTVLSLALGVNVRRRMNQAIPAYGLEEGQL